MYSVTTMSFGHVAHLSFMGPHSRFMLWIFVAAWALVAAAFLARSIRQQPRAGLAAAVLAARQRGRAFQQQGMDEGLR
jgi:hypothetical protein